VLPFSMITTRPSGAAVFDERLQAVRIAERYGCEITAVNISREQIRQGRQLIEQRRLSHRVRIVRGDARSLDFHDGSFRRDRLHRGGRRRLCRPP
jgi:hypothetical protein